MARLRLAVPPSYFRVGESTWIWWEGIPIFSGSRRLTSSTTVSSARAGSGRRRKNTSCPLSFFSSGATPRFTWWAERMMALWAA